MKQKKSFHVQRQLIMIALSDFVLTQLESFCQQTMEARAFRLHEQIDGKSLVVAERILVNPQLLRDVDETKKLKLIIKRRIFRENFL